MKKYLLISLLILAVLSLTACNILPRVDPGNQVSETRDVSGFNEVRFKGVGELFITQGETEALMIETGEKIMPHITTEVVNGVLIIGMDNSGYNFSVPTPITFRLTVKDLNRVDLSGAGNIQANELRSDNIKFNLSGAGNINVENLQAESVESSLSGAGNISMAGKVPMQASLLTGLGSYQAGDLESSTVKVEVTGAGGATVWATELLDVIISGAGSVEYYGSPRVSEDVNGLGSVRSLGNK